MSMVSLFSRLEGQSVDAYLFESLVEFDGERSVPRRVRFGKGYESSVVFGGERKHIVSAIARMSLIYGHYSTYKCSIKRVNASMPPMYGSCMPVQ